MQLPKYKDRFGGNEKWYLEKMKLLDQKIQSFDCCLMSNSKWRRLFLAILENKSIIKHCEIAEFAFKNNATHWVNSMKLDDENIKGAEFIFGDYIDEHFAGGHNPISYREIEYIEFRKIYFCRTSHPVHKLKHEDVRMEQDLELIKKILSNVGQFCWDETDQYKRILGYK